MADLFASGRIVDAILVLVLLEGLLLLWLRSRRQKGPMASALVSNLVSGAALMLSLRAGLTGEHWSMVAGWLIVALVAHLTEMTLRFRETRDPSRGAVTGRGGTTGSDFRSVRIQR